MSRSVAARGAVAVVALAGGAVVGTASVLLHDYVWGLLLGVLATWSLLAAIPGGWWRRLPFALGWCLAVLVLTDERAEGDLLVRADTRGYLLLAAGVVVLMGGVVGLVRHRAPETGAPGSGAPLS